jgi:hypothetical protein
VGLIGWHGCHGFGGHRCFDGLSIILFLSLISTLKHENVAGNAVMGEFVSVPGIRFSVPRI